MPEHRTAFDGSIRRRIHLFRHGDVSYISDNGDRVPDSRLVPLTDWGRKQAAEMGEFMDGTPFDRAICSGLPRTVETAEGVLNGRPIDLQHMPAFEEITSGDPSMENPPSLEEIAYVFSNAHEPGKRFIFGELFVDFQSRVLEGLNEVLGDQSWTNLALIAHGGTNRVILGWALGNGLQAFQSLEQNTCCLNVIDVDTNPSTWDVVRTLVRVFNLTTYDQARHQDHFTTMEALADRFRL
jgi:probable phosphoglycerate mutase